MHRIDASCLVELVEIASVVAALETPEKEYYLKSVEGCYPQFHIGGHREMIDLLQVMVTGPKEDSKNGRHDVVDTLVTS